MHSWIVVALVGSSASVTISDTPHWQTNYALAKRTVAEQKKPMALVFGSGKDGWTKLTKEGAIDAKVSKVLNDHFVCTYVDTTTEQGQDLASRFAVTAKTGLIVSDRSGQLQAFYHNGDLTKADLLSTLEKYSNPDLQVSRTETVVTPNSLGVTTTTSNYLPVNNNIAPVTSSPVQYSQPTTPSQPVYSYQPSYNTVPNYSFTPRYTIRSGGS